MDIINALIKLDSQAFLYINNLQHNFIADFVFVLIHNLTRQGLIYFIAVVFLLMRRDAPTRLLVTLAMISGFATYIVNDLILKNIFQRTRPLYVLSQTEFVSVPPDSYSMPSGQAAVAFAVFTMVWLVLPSKILKIGFLIFALLVAFDRIYLGHHYPSDVFVGAVVGVIISSVIYRYRKSIFFL